MATVLTRRDLGKTTGSAALPKLAGASAVWPFETGWAAKAKWLPAHVLILHAEIYPSVRDSLPDEIKDRGQVRAMWQWARPIRRCRRRVQWRREHCITKNGRAASNQTAWATRRAPSLNRPGARPCLPLACNPMPGLYGKARDR
jgi:hypothetical protein